MNSTRWAKISEILEAALERKEPERSSYLAQVCGEDIELKKEVESLLSYEETENDFFENRQINPLDFGETDKISNNYIGNKSVNTKSQNYSVKEEWERFFWEKEATATLNKK